MNDQTERQLGKRYEELSALEEAAYYDWQRAKKAAEVALVQLNQLSPSGEHGPARSTLARPGGPGHLETVSELNMHTAAQAAAMEEYDASELAQLHMNRSSFRIGFSVGWQAKQAAMELSGA